MAKITNFLFKNIILFEFICFLILFLVSLCANSTILGFCVLAIFFILIATVHFKIYRKIVKDKQFNLNYKTCLIVWGIIIIISNIAVYFLIKGEHTIYSWDYFGYWKKSNQMAELAVSPLQCFINVINTANRTDYGTYICLFTAPFIMIFGVSRVVYVLTMLNVFVLPLMFLLSMCIILLMYYYL